MNKNEISTLNWDEFNKFEKSGDRNAMNHGVKFENLIEKLLNAMFSKDYWRRTQATHDGKKDFVHPFDTTLTESEWAECKNYRDNLSINVISPTLIMGALDNIGSFYFFSRTFLNENAIASILRYADITKTNIKVIDGALLELYIYEFLDISVTNKFFPSTKKIPEIINCSPRIIVLLKDKQGNILSSNYEFNIGEPVDLYIIIQNISLYETNYEMKIDLKNKVGSLSNFVQSTYNLLSAKIKEHIFPCDILSNGKLKFEITITGNFKTITKSLSRIVKDEPHTFWAGKNSIKIVDTCKKYLDNTYTVPLIIAGKNGSGKSTLLNILNYDNCLLKKFFIINFFYNLERNEIAKSILNDSVGIKYDANPPSDQVFDENKKAESLTQNYVKSNIELANCVLKLYSSERPFLFIVDEAEKINNSYITFIKALLNKATKANIKIYFIFALNIDIRSVNEFYELMNWGIIYENKECKIINMEYFDKEDIIRYFKLRFGIQDLENCFEAESYRISPLVVNMLANSLLKNDIICKINNKTYVIRDVCQFRDKVIALFYGEYQLKEVCHSIGLNDIPNFVLKYIYICGEMKHELSKEYNTSVNALINYGILKKGGNSVTVTHDKFLECIKNQLTITKTDYVDIFDNEFSTEAAKIVCAINLLGIHREAKCFLENCFVNKTNSLNPIRRHEICLLIFQNFNKISSENLITESLELINLNFKKLEEEQGHDNFFKYLYTITKIILVENWDINSSCVNNVIGFVRKFADRSLSTYNSGNNIKIIIEFIKKLTATKNISQKDKYYWISYFYNRIAISEDRRNATLEIESRPSQKYYELSRKFYIKAEYPIELKLQMIADEFNEKYIYTQSLQYDYIVESLTSINEIIESNIERKSFLKFHKNLFTLLKSILSQNNLLNITIDDIDKEIKDSKNNSEFYTAKFYLIKIYILMYEQKIDEANGVLKEATEYVYLHDLRHYIYRFTYIQAQLNRFNMELNKENHANALPISVIALKQFLDARSKSEADFKREIYLARQLLKYICSVERNYAYELISKHKLLKKYLSNFENEILSNTKRSYFVINNVDFPPI